MVLFAKSLSSLLLVTLLSLAWVGVVAADVTPQEKEDMDRYFIKFNGILWISFIFLYLALTAAWKIATDNAPDARKDSILYARFLTQNFNARAHAN